MPKETIDIDVHFIQQKLEVEAFVAYSNVSNWNTKKEQLKLDKLNETIED